MTILDIFIYIILFIWQLPQNLLAIIIYPFLGNKKIICYRNNCLCFCCSRMTGGVSLGNFAYVGCKLDKYSISHEVDGHTVQSKLLGPLYLIIIGIPSFIWCNIISREKHPNYYEFFTEKWANSCAGLEVVNHKEEYYLIKKNNFRKNHQLQH